MKATGIVRKIDDLGRIVIPKEIRKALRIRQRDALEIYVDGDGEVILKKYAPLGRLLEIASSYAGVLSKVSEMNVCITDNSTVIATAGTNKKEYLDKEISEDLINLIEERTLWINKNGYNIKITDEDASEKYKAELIAPIISESDLVGAVIIFSSDINKQITESEINLIKAAALFLGKQVE